MWVVIEGLAGSGKSWLMSRLIRKEWRYGSIIWANYKLNFSAENEDIHRFRIMDEIYHLNHAVIGVDEIQDLAGHWSVMPVTFRNKIAHHRHNRLTVYSNTQDFHDLHVELRRNVHEIYRCQTIFRFPNKDHTKPILQIIRVIHKTRKITNDDDSIKFVKTGYARFHFISRFWTREYYDTFQDIDFDKYICKIKLERKPGMKKAIWSAKIYSRDMVNNGKARI
jgi:hypothetical protein